MSVIERYQEIFTKDNLTSLYINKIKPRAGIGTDGINTVRFEKRLSQELEIILGKVNNMNYKFTPYKCICLPKGINKYPRIIEKPTIRDKIVLRATFEILIDLYEHELSKRTLHLQIKNMINTYRQVDYDHVLRFDVKDFYPSINHQILLSKLKLDLSCEEITSVIEKAIKNTSDLKKKNNILENNVGVPQGLSISNILSSVYIFNIDEKYDTNSTIEYNRFVDDILIFCNTDSADEIEKEITNDFNKIGLSLHNDNKKYCSQTICKEFDYLGYNFNNFKISVRKESKEKIISSLIRIVSSFKYSKKRNIELLFFKLNLRITGCINDNQKYGWIFYFSQITDEKLLHELDHKIRKHLKINSIDTKRLKSFSRAWHELSFKIKHTNYIPNFDKFTIEHKKSLLLLNKYTIHDDETDTDIEIKFNKLIYREIKSLEKDLSSFS